MTEKGPFILLRPRTNAAVYPYYLEHRDIHLFRGETTLIFLFRCLFFASTVNQILKVRDKTRVNHHILILRKISKPNRLTGEARLIHISTAPKTRHDKILARELGFTRSRVDG